MAVRRSNGVRMFARSAQRVEAPFTCPGCGEEVTLRKGQIRTHHFAHKPPVTCAMGLGETLDHQEAKQAIYDALVNEPNVEDLDVERRFGISVADVYARINGSPVAVEIQRSTLSVNDIAARTKNYRRLGIAVLWVGFGKHLPDDGERYEPKAWEKWCHGAYFGRVYYWLAGQTFVVVHFDPFTIHVDAREWYEPGGVLQVAGGYSRTSRRWRRTNEAPDQVILSRDFQVTNRAAWTGGSVSVPDCRLYVDQRAVWW